MSVPSSEAPGASTESKGFIQAAALGKSYGDYPVLRGVDCTIAGGEFVAIMGDSGSGKTTFLNLLAGLDTADDGILRVAGEEPARYSAAQLAEYRRRTVAMIFQDFNLLPTLSVLENITLPVLMRGEKADLKRARYYLERVGMLGHSDQLPETLSGGEMQRVSIARALNLQPRLLLADEPTGSLDSRNSDEVLELLGEINRETQLTLVMVTHSARAAEAAGRTLRMNDGHLSFSQATSTGSPE
ncbi:MAG: ABC transporter ATP-binding protein [bacterium]|nr:ABC transporter ATP-binding protein [bacterium]